MNYSFNKNVPDYIRSLVPYVPGKPIEETQREYRIKRVIKLASNENPLGPSPKALKAVARALREGHRYPDGAAFSLKRTLSEHLGVETQKLVVGNGSNEIIDFLIRTYCQPGDCIVTSQAAFIAYRICAQIHGVKTLEAPLTVDLRFNLDSMLDLVQENERARIVFIANPNNPTGTYVTAQELRKFLEKLTKFRGDSVLVALDYAYWEYVTAKDLPDPMNLMSEFPNVIILRTFSKIYGLAGFRAGYGIASSEIISNLEKIRQPFNMNSLALVAAEAALSDQTFVAKSRRINQSGMRFWEKKLGDLGIPYLKSQGNFLLADVKHGLEMSGSDVYTACLKKGIIFRPVSNYGLFHMLRISIGTSPENTLAARVLSELSARPLTQRTKSRDPVRRTKVQ